MRLRIYLLTLLLIAAMSVQSAVIYINQNVSSVGDGSSWNQAFSTISSGLAVAQAGDEIWIAQGTYLPANTLAVHLEVSVYGGFSGEETGLAQRDIHAYPAIIDGQNSIGLFDNNGKIDGLKIIDGNSLLGAGVLQHQGSIENCIIEDCASKMHGGGALIMSGNMINTVVTKCNAGYNGGGIYCSEDVVLYGVTVDHCRAQDHGGGIMSSSQSIMNSCIVTGNLAMGCGGGIYGSGSVLHSTVEYNESDEHGGGIFLVNGTLDTVEVNNNVGDDLGGGIYAEGTVLFTDCTVKYNTSRRNGGGAYLLNNCDILHSDFVGNKAWFNGGGVYLESAKNISDCRFLLNQSFYGGAGLYLEEGLDVTQCEFFGNRSHCIIQDLDEPESIIENRQTLVPDYHGGALYLLNSGSVSNCSVYMNTSSSYQFEYSSILTRSSGDISDCRVYKNSGRAIYIYSGGNVNDVEIADQVSYRSGAGIYMTGSGNIENCTMDNITLKSQTDLDGTEDQLVTLYSGGALYFVNSGTVKNCTITDVYANLNTAEDKLYGGFIYIADSEGMEGITMKNGSIAAYEIRGGGIYASNVTNVSDAHLAPKKAGDYSLFSAGYFGYGVGMYADHVTSIQNCSAVNTYMSAKDTVYGGGLYGLHINKVQNFSVDNSYLVGTVMASSGGFYGEYIDSIKGLTVSNNRCVTSLGLACYGAMYLKNSGNVHESDFCENQVIATTIYGTVKISGVYAEALATVSSCKFYGNALQNLVAKDIELIINSVFTDFKSYEGMTTVHIMNSDMEFCKIIDIEAPVDEEDENLMHRTDVRSSEIGVLNEGGSMTSCTVYDFACGIKNNGQVVNCLVYSCEGIGIINESSGKVHCSSLSNNAKGIENSGEVINTIAWGSSQNDIDDQGGTVQNSIFKEAEISPNVASNPHFEASDDEYFDYDLRVQANSPALDSGTESGLTLPAYDFEGSLRIQGNGVDIGAYEDGGMPLYVNFTATPVSGVMPLEVQFMNLSHGIIVRYEWDFDNDGTIDSTDSGGFHTYTQPGLYTVKLIAYGNGGSITEVKTDYIAVGERWYVSKSGSDANSGIKWSEAFLTLSKAQDVAKVNHKIWVAEGVYNLSHSIEMAEGAEMYGGFIGSEEYLSERVLSSSHTILNGMNQYRGIKNFGIIDGFTIFNCLSEYSGGGVYNGFHSTLRNCIISQCVGKYGGGVYNNLGTVENCLVFDNEAEIGGGIYNFEGTVQFSTITSNSSQYEGDGIYSDQGNILNSIVWYNEDDQNIYGGNVLNCCYAQAENQDGNISDIPEFSSISGDLDEWDFHLKASSPCIDSASSISSITTDLDGMPRPQGNDCDMGAYESSYQPLQMELVTVTGLHSTLIGQPLKVFVAIKNTGKNSWLPEDKICLLPRLNEVVGLNISVCSLEKEVAPGEIWELYLTFSASQKVETRIFFDLMRYDEAIPGDDICFSLSFLPENILANEGVIYVSPNGDDADSGQSWAHAFKTIVYALSVAENNSQIWIQKGLYPESQTLIVPESITLYGNFSGAESTIGQRNMSELETIIDGNEDKQPIRNSGTLNGLLIRKGLAEHGGGIYSMSGLIENCQIEDCHAHYYGGGIYAQDTEIRSSTVDDCSCGYDGGGIYTVGLCALQNLVIENNFAQDHAGGLYLAADSTFRNSKAGFNHARDLGGGVYACGVINACDIYDNYTIEAGGGLYLDSGLITSSFIYNNESDDSGGGFAGTARGLLTDLDVHDNRSYRHGGGGYLLDSVGINNCEFSNNYAMMNGGGFYGLRLESVDSCFAKSNRGGFGGVGFYLKDSGDLSACSVLDNTACYGETIRYADRTQIDAAGIWMMQSGSCLSSTVSNNTHSGLVHSCFGVYMKDSDIIENCTINNNSGNGLVSEACAQIRDCSIYDNNPSALSMVVNGGGIHHDGSGSILNCQISNNKTRQHGGGISLESTALVEDCQINGNRSSGGLGTGGIYSQNGLNLNRCELFLNASSSKFTGVGAINVNSGSLDYPCNITNCMIYGNTGSSTIESLVAPCYMLNLEVYNNSGLSTLHVSSNFPDSIIEKCQIYDNSGRGLKIMGGKNPFLISKCRIFKNSTIGGTNELAGGGVYNTSSVLSNCIIYKNHAAIEGDGGNVYSPSNGQMVNCTVYAGTVMPESDDDEVTGGVLGGLMLMNCISWDNQDNNVSGVYTTHCLYGGTRETGNIYTDPLFVRTTGDYHDYDFHLDFLSDAIDSGTMNGNHIPLTDMDGKARPLGKTIDMGAYENVGSGLTPFFTASPRYGKKPLVVDFYDSSEGPVTQWFWDFENDGIFDSTERNPTHTYTENGLYAVRLRVIGAQGMEELVREEYIRVAEIWYVSEYGNDDNDGKSWAGSFKTIDKAISSITYGNSIWIAGGTYPITQTQEVLMDVSIYGGFAGTETYVSQRIPGENTTVIDCGNQIRGFKNYGLLDSLTVMKAKSYYSGGAVYNGDPKAVVQNCIFYDNDGKYGGGVYNKEGTVLNCLIYNNKAQIGGGIYNYKGRVQNCTIYNNQGTTKSPGIFSDEGDIVNSIVWDNGALDIDGGTIQSCCYGQADGSDGNFNLDPQFISIPNLDFHLQASSPCIDKGSFDGAPEIDLDGTSRPQGFGMDMGAFEWIPFDYDTLFISCSLPNTVYLDRDYIVSFDVKNAGSITWLEEGDFSLDCIGEDTDYLHEDYLSNAVIQSVALGDVIRFYIPMEFLTLGTYSLDWSMAHQSEPFGEAFHKEIEVLPVPETAVESRLIWSLYR